MFAAPILETERLRLRPYGRDDFPALHAMWADPVVMRHVLGRSSTEEETWARLLRYAGLWPLLGTAIGRSKSAAPAASSATSGSRIFGAR